MRSSSKMASMPHCGNDKQFKMDKLNQLKAQKKKHKID